MMNSIIVYMTTEHKPKASMTQECLRTLMYQTLEVSVKSTSGRVFLVGGFHLFVSEYYKAQKQVYGKNPFENYEKDTVPCLCHGLWWSLEIFDILDIYKYHLDLAASLFSWCSACVWDLFVNSIFFL